MPLVDTYKPGIDANVTLDNQGRTRAIKHRGSYWVADANAPVAAALEYLGAMTGEYSALAGRLDGAGSQARHDRLDPEAGHAYRLARQRHQFDTTSVGFAQTYHEVPVWNAGIRVLVKGGPSRVVTSQDDSHPDFEIALPNEKKLHSLLKLREAAAIATAQRRALGRAAKVDDKAGASFVKKTVDKKAFSEAFATTDATHAGPTRVIDVKLWVYRYDAEDRLPHAHGEDGDTAVPTIPVPDVPEDIVDGHHYFVAEVVFALENQHFPWRALVEVDSGAVLYLRPFADGVDGKAFKQDPISATGDSSNTHDQPNSVLNPLRDTVTLNNLDPASGGVQSLSGTYVALSEEENPVVAAPTQPSGSDFDYDVRTNEFAAVSAYFHINRIFETFQDLGFVVEDYFSNTDFPVEADHRGMGGVVNAHCVGDGMGGIDHCCYGTMHTDVDDGTLCRAADPRVHWHEVCGHGILYEAVNHANFGFAHSAGDGIAGIFHDPKSQAPGSQRFEYVPWHPTLRRYLNRDPASGWAWGGSRDNRGYGAEEILGTCHFRMYRAMGGDAPWESRQVFASRMALYLIFRAIGDLTTNPQYARDYCEVLQDADAGNWSSEGVFGGAYHKLIRWCFEQQGEYQDPPLTVSDPDWGTVTGPGAPPPVDVYIDDGRAGGYDFLQKHWKTTTMWNRISADGGTDHEVPVLDQTNYMYVKVKNRGTTTATNVVVRGYHTKPGAGLSWPADFEAFDTPEIAVGTVLGNDAEEKIVGPFEWVPNINGLGHDCTLMVVSADGDAPNTESFGTGEHIAEWRLVPHDNNIAQRNVYPVPGAGGEQELLAALDGAVFWVGNPNPRAATIDFDLSLPDVLVRTGWRLSVSPAAGFVLQPGEKRAVTMRLDAGASFTADQIRASTDRDVEVLVLADGAPLGGMAYRVDPDLAVARNPVGGSPKVEGNRCAPAAQKLLDCLGMPDADVGCVQVEKVTVGITMKKSDCC